MYQSRSREREQAPAPRRWRLRRILPTASTVLCALLFAGCLRSCYYADRLLWDTDGHLIRDRRHYIASEVTLLEVYLEGRSGWGPPLADGYTDPDGFTVRWETESAGTYKGRGANILGFRWHCCASSPDGRPWEFWVIVPYWFLILLTSLYVIDWVLDRPQRRAKRRLARGHCPECDYDLRAHEPGQRCPECGAPIPANLPRQPLTETKPPTPAPHSDKGNDRDASGS